MRPEVARPLEATIKQWRALDLGDTFDPQAAVALVKTGLSSLCVPAEVGGLGASMSEAAEVLLALGAIDGSSALGFAMHVHVTGAMCESESFARPLREQLYRAILDDGALLNNAATEEGGGSPARGAIPGTIARQHAEDPAGPWRLTGEKTWTTWLPNLRFALVTARVGSADEVGRFLVDLEGTGVERRPGFEAMGMRGSASGRLVLTEAPGEPVDDRGPARAAWFGIAMGATYLGVGEGARRKVARWALDRRPGDGSTAVADIPSVRLRLGRLDATLRTARIVLLAAARGWDEGRDATDIALAKIVATRAAVDATDDALRIAGGPGFLVGRLERAFRDARAGLINPPLEDVALDGFARMLLDRERGGSGQDPG